jgi:hypothetical protein
MKGFLSLQNKFQNNIDNNKAYDKNYAENDVSISER